MNMLDVRTHFSLGESVVKIDELVEYAKANSYSSVAICDTMNISGMIDFSKKCVEAEIRPVVGVRLRLVADPKYRKPKLGEPVIDNREYYVKAFIKNDAGWHSIMRLLSLGLSEDYFYYRSRIGLSDLLAELATGDNLLITSGDFNGVFAHPQGAEIWSQIKSVSPSALGEIIPLDTPFWSRLNEEVAKNNALDSVVATWPVLYLNEGDADARDVSAAIMAAQLLSNDFRLVPHTRCHVPITSGDLLERLYASASISEKSYGAALTVEMAESAYKAQKTLIGDCTFIWAKMPISLPSMAPGSEFEHMIRLCKEGWVRRFSKPVLGHTPAAADLAEYKTRLKFELSVIQKMSFERYFLLVTDVVGWAKESGIVVGPGRGSVGGSLVAYLLGITDVDPIRFKLLFERFISPERLDLPDADLDFQSSRREEIIGYLVAKYGRTQVAGISNFTTMASASALRDTGRVCEIQKDEMEITKLVPKEHGKPYELTRAADEVPAIDAFRGKFPKEWNIATRLEGVMRSFGRHAAGVVVAGEDLRNRAVVETHRGEPVVNWDKAFVEDLGLVKMDILGLSTLDVIQAALTHIKDRTGASIDMLALPLDDVPTLEAFGRGDTVGVFQFESSGMRNLLKDLGAVSTLTFEDLAAATALYRPGPKDSGLLEDYVSIRQGLKRPYYEHPNMIPALEATLGVMIYQESVMQITRDLCGFTAAEADAARKAMGKKDKDKMEKLRAKFVSGALKTSEMDERASSGLFDKIMNFAAYGFNRSHAVEYSVISYWTMWLKVNYPPEFFAATLTVLGEDKMDGLVRDARKRGIEIMPPRINMSTQRFEIISEGLSGELKAVLITPFNRVHGISENTATVILEGRAKVKKFTSVQHFEDNVNKTKCNKRHREALNLVGAFHSIDPGSAGPLHPDRRKDQMLLMPGLIIDHVKSSRSIITADEIKDILIAEVIRPSQTCKNCSLSGGVHPIPRLGAKAKVMIVTDSPNYSEEGENKMYSGKASAFLKRALDLAELKTGDAYFTALVKSPKSGKMLANEQINGCSAYLVREIEILKPPIILALGSATVNFLVPGLKGGITEHLGRVHYDSKRDANIIIGFNPASIAFNPEKQNDLNDLLATVAELIL